MSRCRSCNHEIVWATNPAGRHIPFDLAPDTYAGHWTLTRSGADMLAKHLPDGPELQRAMRDGVELYLPHHCPARNPRY